MHPPSAASGPSRIERWLNVAVSSLPSVSYDGESVLFVSDREGLPEPYTVSSSGGVARRLLASSERVAAVIASPVGPRAVLAVDVGGNEHWQLAVVSSASDGGKADPVPRPLVSDPSVIHTPGFWTDDGREFLFTSNARDRRFFDVYSVGMDGRGAPKRVLTGDGWHYLASARDGRAVVGRSNAPLDVDLFLLEGERTVHLNPHVGEVAVFDASLGRDAVYGSTNPGREFTGLVRFPFGGSGPEFLREYGADVETVQVSPNGETIAFTVNRDGFSELHFLTLSSLEDRRVPMSPRGVIASLGWFPDSSAIVYDLSSPAGLDVYRRVVDTGKARRLTESPVPLPMRTPEAHLRSCVAEDGIKVPYWEHVPPSGAPKGTIVLVHGGPESQARPRFNPVVGYLVESGWRVVEPNVRGSLGYGRTYVHLDDVRKRMDSVRDLRDVVRALARAGQAPPGATAVIGGSYGGFMVLSALTTYPDLFAAGVDIVGISNLVTFLEQTGPWRRRHREAEYGSLERDRDFLREISPLHRADRIEVPLLVIHGRNDPRVPAGEAEQIVATMRARGRPVELLMFEDEGHGILRRPNRMVAWSRAVGFLEQHLDPATAPRSDTASHPTS